MASSAGRKVLIAMDESEHAVNALKYYKEYLFQESDDVIVVYAVEFGTFVSQSSFSADPQHMARMAEEVDNEVQKVIQRLTSTLKEAGLQGQVHRLWANSAGEAVVKAARDMHAQLIVTGSRGQGKVRRTLLGSVSQYVLHHAQVPVLVCRFK